jgi:hypothetical protein
MHRMCLLGLSFDWNVGRPLFELREDKQLLYFTLSYIVLYDGLYVTVP